MRNSKKIVSCLLAALTVASMTACGPTGQTGAKEDPDNLAVYCVELGFGKDWCEQALKEFEKQDWVKEKYPNLTTTFISNTVESFATDKIKAGKGGNPYDLLFGSYLTEFKEGTVTDLTNTVYNTKVPGEEVLYKDKMFDTYKNYLKVSYEQNENESEKVWYYAPWAHSLCGIIYNKELLTELGYQMPVTTDEFLALCNTLTNLKTDKYSKGYAATSSYEGDAYWSYWFYDLWAQYDTVDGYVNFYSGIDDYDSRSNKIFQRKGRLYAAEVLQEMYKFENGYINRAASEMGYMTAQLAFLKGDGIFMPNGSWFSHEMSYLKQKAIDDGQKVYEIDYLPTPIVSKIIEKTPSINDDATLQAVIRAIDAGETSYASVSAADFKIIADARKVVYSQAPDHQAVVPEIADSKEVAYDFLRFLATDEAIELYAKYATGSMAPFKYDIEVKNPTLFNTFDTMQKSRWVSAKSETMLPGEDNFSLFKKGGVSPFRTAVSYLYQKMSPKDSTITAQILFNETIEYWNNTNFADALTKAGLA